MAGTFCSLSRERCAGAHRCRRCKRYTSDSPRSDFANRAASCAPPTSTTIGISGGRGRAIVVVRDDVGNLALLVRALAVPDWQILADGDTPNSRHWYGLLSRALSESTGRDDSAQNEAPNDPVCGRPTISRALAQLSANHHGQMMASDYTQ